MSYVEEEKEEEDEDEEEAEFLRQPYSKQFQYAVRCRCKDFKLPQFEATPR